MSVVEDRKVQLAQACRIGNRGDRGDLAVPDTQIEHGERRATPRWRGLATRYGLRAVTYRAMVVIASIALWLPT